VEAVRIDSGAVRQEFRHALDSSQAHPPPPPAWFERIAPGAAARANARNGRPSPTISAAVGIWAIVVGTAIIAAVAAFLVGTVGWLATLPLAYGLTGHWIGSRIGTDPRAATGVANDPMMD
jgi:hypothetical protein